MVTLSRGGSTYLKPADDCVCACVCAHHQKTHIFACVELPGAREARERERAASSLSSLPLVSSVFPRVQLLIALMSCGTSLSMKSARVCAPGGCRLCVCEGFSASRYVAQSRARARRQAGWTRTPFSVSGSVRDYWYEQIVNPCGTSYECTRACVCVRDILPPFRWRAQTISYAMGREACSSSITHRLLVVELHAWLCLRVSKQSCSAWLRIVHC